MMLVQLTNIHCCDMHMNNCVSWLVHIPPQYKLNYCKISPDRLTWIQKIMRSTQILLPCHVNESTTVSKQFTPMLVSSPYLADPANSVKYHAILILTWDQKSVISNSHWQTQQMINKMSNNLTSTELVSGRADWPWPRAVLCQAVRQY
jgi:hypothetical protein